jgi:hypothetical protein
MFKEEAKKCVEDVKIMEAQKNTTIEFLRENKIKIYKRTKL